jgi:hypothetical protein
MNDAQKSGLAHGTVGCSHGLRGPGTVSKKSLLLVTRDRALTAARAFHFVLNRTPKTHRQTALRCRWVAFPGS